MHALSGGQMLRIKQRTSGVVSRNETFRGKYAGQGDVYDPVNDVFVSPVSESVEE